MMLTVDDFMQLAPTARRSLVEDLVPAYNLLLPIWAIDTPMRVAHFLAQTCHETAHFTTLVEIAAGSKEYAPYFGRGVIQLTWESGYAKMGQRLSLPLVKDPELVSTPGLGTMVACMYWTDHSLNRWADEDNAIAIGRAINRGSAHSDKEAYGEEERAALTKHAKALLGAEQMPSVAPTPPAGPMDGEEVQQALHNLGYYSGEIDGIVSVETRKAIKAFQQDMGLKADSIAGEKTQAKLRAKLYGNIRS